MDNESKINNVNNTSTQKTVRIKPMAKQPLAGINTESQSVKKVATNPGADVVTNTARIVKLNVRPNAAAPTIPAIQPATAGADTQTAAMPKAPAPVSPAITLPETDAGNTQTAAMPKAPAPAKPTINLTPAQPIVNAPVVPHTVNVDVASANQVSEDATVKLKRPARKTVPPTAAAAPQPAAAPEAPAAPAVPSIAPAVTSKTPTVQLKVNKEAEAPVENAAAPAAEAAETSTAAAPKVKKSKKAKVAAAVPIAIGNDDMFAFRLSIGFVVALFLIAAVTFCTVQYFNMYQPGVFGKYIQIPFMENVGK